MSDETLNPNIEWKKKSFEHKERLSRRIDAKQATLAKIKKKNDFNDSFVNTSLSLAPFSSHLKKMRKKIKDALDEEEDDEDEYNIIIDNSLLFLEEKDPSDFSLFQKLSESEKNFIAQRQTLQSIHMQQNASKLFALSKINNLAQKAGLGPLSPQDVAENMQNNGWGKETFQMALQHNVAPDIKIGFAKLDEKKIKDLMQGIKRLQKIGGFAQIRGMKIDDVINITSSKNDDKKVAQLLLKKTGRKPNPQKKKNKQRQPLQKVSFKKLLQQKQDRQFTRA